MTEKWTRRAFFVVVGCVESRRARCEWKFGARSVKMIRISEGHNGKLDTKSRRVTAS